MATENIVKGIAYRIKAAAEGVWDKCSFWTHADDLEFSDGQNASTKLSAINGITDDLSCEDASIALSAAAGKQLNESLGGLTFTQDSEGNWGYLPSGADSVIPFKTGGEMVYTGCKALNTSSFVDFTCGFEPQYAIVCHYYTTSDKFMVIYVDYRTNEVTRLTINYNASATQVSFSSYISYYKKTSTGVSIKAIDSDYTHYASVFLGR